MSSTSDKHKPFDVAEYLVDLHDIAGYLELAIEESTDDLPPCREFSGRSPAHRT